MSLIKANGAGDQDTGFYNNVVNQSLRFNSADTASLSWSPSSAGNRKKWTFSTWLKRSTITNASSGDVYIFSQATGSNNNDSFIALIFRGDDLDVTCHSLEVLRSDAKFRDVGAWYHILWVLDTENSTASHRMRLYVNGDEITSFSTDNRSNSVLNGTNMPILNNATHYIGRYGGDTSRNFDGYLAYTELVEGEALTPSSFTEEKNGVLIPIEYTGDHGTYGFRLEYKETGDGSSSASSSTIGADTKSNATKQHWNDNNLDAHDSNMPDSPENNFCTFNPIGRRYGQSYVGTFSEGNLKVASGGNATHVFGTMAINQIASQGGVYFEVRLDSQDTSRTYVGVFGDTGANNKASNSNAASYSFPIKGLLRPSAPDGSMASYFGTDTDGSGATDLSSHVSAYSNGDILGVAILSDGKTFFHKNGTYIDDASGNVGNPSTGANPAGTIDLTKGDFVPYVGYNSTFSINFGQDSTYAGQESSGGNSDANGIGDFAYAVPTNCLALCTSNIPEPTIGANSDTQADDHFNTVLYTGTGSAQSITGVGFQPDWVWLKKRSADNSHALFDSSRGSGSNGFYRLATNLTTEEQDPTNVASLDADGFTLGSNAGTNGDGSTLVAWNWKANGGTTSSNTDGSITSTVQANTTAGFSIVTYTGNGTNSSDITIGHSLGVTPRMVIVKNRTDATRWQVYHEDLSADGSYTKKNIVLNSTSAESGYSSQIKAVSSTTFTVRDVNANGNANVNKNNSNYVAYCFAEIEGYSKYGTFVGNGASGGDAPFVYLGFRPAWVIIKRTSSTGSWYILDNKREGLNPDNDELQSDTTQTEQANQRLDLLSNGFKLRQSFSETNSISDTFLYMAFAEQSFRYANAR